MCVCVCVCVCGRGLGRETVVITRARDGSNNKIVSDCVVSTSIPIQVMMLLESVFG